MKPARSIAIVVSVVQLAASSHAMARTLTPADDVFRLQGYDLSEYSIAPASRKNLAGDITADIKEKGNSDWKGMLLGVTGNPGTGFGRPDHVPANPGRNHGRPDHVPPVNPPFDTPAVYNGLLHAPDTMPASVPYHTLPGSGFGQVVVPVPAAAWLFGSGLLGLIGMARRRKQ